MLEFKAVMGANGRILFPVKCREALHLSPGETVIIRIEGDEARVFSAEVAIARAQSIVTKAMKGKKGLVEELIAARRAEARNDE